MGIAVTSDAQRTAVGRREVPPPEEVRPGVFAIAVPMPGSALVHSYAYLVDGGDGTLHLIDTGLDAGFGPGADAEPGAGPVAFAADWAGAARSTWDALRTAIRSLGYAARDVATVTVTHAHLDHMGLASRVRDHSGAAVRMHRLEARSVRAAVAGVVVSPDAQLESWGVPVRMREEMRAAAAALISSGPRAEADVLLEDGDELVLGRRRWRVLHTPGHTPGHICVVAPEERLVFTGDHVLPGINPGVGLGVGLGFDGGDDIGGNPMREYLGSLDRIAALGDLEVCPGHGYRFRGSVERCRELAEHHRVRGERAVRLAEEDASASVWRVAERLPWSQGWDGLAGPYRFSALRQTAMHLGRWSA